MTLTEYTLEFTYRLVTGEDVEVRIWFSEEVEDFNTVCAGIIHDLRSGSEFDNISGLYHYILDNYEDIVAIQVSQQLDRYKSGIIKYIGCEECVIDGKKVIIV